MNWEARTRRLVAINVIGGLGVLGSYLWGALAQPAAMDALWGGVPVAARGWYAVNMFLAAAGFLVFSPYIVFRLDGGANAFMPGRLATLYLAILIPSAAWLPLTAWMVVEPRAWLWWAIRVDLLLVALGSLGLLLFLVFSDPARRSRVHGPAVLGAAFFCLQTVILDAILWPMFFPAHG